MNSERESNLGVVLGLVAATGYSITNLALRKLATGDGGLTWDVFVSGAKALPTFVAAGLLMLLSARRGKTVLPPARLVWPLVLTAIVMQFGGNVGFQLALRSIGLAISVPIVFSSIIVSGAMLGRVALGDPVSRRTAISMALMVVSIGFLSAAAQKASVSEPVAEPVVLHAATASTGLFEQAHQLMAAGGVTFGVIIALISGFSYGVCGVVIRRVVRGTLPVETTLFLFSTTGLLALWPISIAQLGAAGLQQITLSDWTYMLAAGVFNAVGFFAITHAMRYLTISRANVINASQNAMCAVGAVVFFAEPMSMLAISGIGLTIVGLLTLDRR